MTVKKTKPRKKRIPVCALGAPNCVAHLPLKVKT